MKKCLLLILPGLLFFNTMHTFSQVFAHPGATWLFENTFIASVCFKTYEKWEYIEDSISDPSIKKVVVTTKIIPPDPLPASTHTSTRFFKVSGDTVFAEGDSGWVELYNFSLQVGDITHSPLQNSFVIDNYFSCDSTQPYQFPAEVTATGTDTVFGEALRYYTVKYRIGNFMDDFSDTTYAYETYHERIITENGYWYPYDAYFCGMINECTPLHLTCYRDDDMSSGSLCNDLSWFETLSVEDAMKDVSLNVYPNPASSYLYIGTNVPELINYRILSIDGKLTGTYKVSSGGIDISSLAPGMYIITNETGSIYRKFMKE